MKLTEEEILDRFERMHVYEGHDYPVFRILDLNHQGEHILEDEYEQVLEKFREWKEKAEKYDSLMNANAQVVKDNINITKEHQIVERLKKLILQNFEHRKNWKNCHCVSCHVLRYMETVFGKDELQKILGNKE